MDNYKTIHTHSSEETTAFGQQLASGIVAGWLGKSAHTHHIYCLYGDLGSGKTTFTQGFAKGLGIQSRVVSPTFLISKRYHTRYEDRFLYHLDIYRMQTEQELYGIGISEIFSDVRSCVIVEWAEKLYSLVPTSRVDIRFTSQSDGSHAIQMQTYG